MRFVVDFSYEVKVETDRTWTDPRYGVGIGFFQDRNDLGIGKSASLNVAHVN